MTPDQQLSILNWHDQPIRIIKTDENIYVPIGDIASAIGITKWSLHRVLNNNSDVFSTYERELQMETPGGKQIVRCLDHDGTLGLIFKLSTNKVAAEKKARVIEFQKWCIKVLGKESVVKEKAPALPYPSVEPDYNAILNKIKFVNALHELTKWDLLELQKEVLREAGMLSLTYHIEPEQKALPAPERKPKDYLTATDIGERIGMSAHEVNMMLYQRKPPLLIKDQKGEWRLTEYGKEYGEERIRELLGGAFVWRIHWKKDILRLFNVHEEMG